LSRKPKSETGCNSEVASDEQKRPGAKLAEKALFYEASFTQINAKTLQDACPWLILAVDYLGGGESENRLGWRVSIERSTIE
jgi:hypothetical protein